MNEEETERIATLMAIMYRVVVQQTAQGKRITRAGLMDAMLPYAEPDMIRKTMSECVDIGQMLDKESKV